MKELFKVIENSFELLEREEDWDDDGAGKAIPEAFNKAMLFMHLMIVKLGAELPIPDINLCRDGSIDIEFENDCHEFLINFKKDSTCCYGDDKNNSDVIKSSDVKTEDIIVWFKKYLLKSNAASPVTTNLRQTNF